MSSNSSKTWITEVETIIKNDGLCLCAAVWHAAQVKVRVRGLGLLHPKLNAGPVCDDSAADINICVGLYASPPYTFTFDNTPPIKMT